MTQVATQPSAAQDRQAEERVSVSDDPTPLALLVSRRLARWFADAPTRSGRPGSSVGAVIVRSHDTPQVVAVRLDQDGCTVTDSLPVQVDAELTVDVGSRFSLVGDPQGERDLWSVVVDALHASPAPWRAEAQRFWDATRDITGIPDILVVHARCADGVEELRVGSGSSQYVMSGTGDQLAGVFSGIDDLLAALESGLAVQGTLADLSVMTAASWRVRYGF